MQPVFILSLPRSGSSWLQRLMSAASSRFASADEPWLLLPLIYALRENAAVAEYDHAMGCQAVRSFFDRLPNGDATYGNLVREFAIGAYTSQCSNGQDLFIDKTPRYSLICDEILRYFPDCKVIILLRNPLAVAASISEIWGGGAWVLYKYDIEFRLGLPNLIRTAELADDRVTVVRYQDLRADADGVVGRLCAWLGVDRDQAPAEAVADANPKRRADALGDTKFLNKNAVLGENSVTWPEFFRTPMRRAWADDLRRAIDLDRLDRFGYNVSEVFDTMHAPAYNPALTLRDVFVTYPLGRAYHLVNPVVYRSRLRRERQIPYGAKFIYR